MTVQGGGKVGGGAMNRHRSSWQAGLKGKRRENGRGGKEKEGKKKKKGRKKEEK